MKIILNYRKEDLKMWTQFSVQLNYMVSSSKNQVAIIVLNSTHYFWAVRFLGVLWQPSLLHSQLILPYVLIRLNCITWVWDHTKSQVEKLMNPNAELQFLKPNGESHLPTDTQRQREIVKNGQFSYLSKYTISKSHSSSTTSENTHVNFIPSLLNLKKLIN